MRQLGDARLLDLVKPATFGGQQHWPSVMLHVGYELARGCGSTAWCAMLANCDNWFAAYWPHAVQKQIWDSDPDALICGTVAPTGKCEAVDGGFLIRGKWPWGSNCDNSEWAFVSAMLPPQGDVTPGVGWFMTPMATLTIDQSSWFVSGMQGTGSKTLIADEPVFVPTERMIRVQDIIPRRVPGAEIEGNVLANFGFATFGAIPLIAVVIGMARGALDVFLQMMRDKVKVSMQPGAPVTAAQSPFVQERAGRASAMIEASRVFVLSELATFEPRVAAGERLTVQERLRIRRAVAFAARESADAVNLIMEIAGASATDLDSPLQRIWRDINTASRHLAFDGTSINSWVGQEMFGMEPVGNF
jgi:3-hydroxy-9,10-secoandrosta-1,3,5(10)-triene-9,17-dione monooxygenase